MKILIAGANGLLGRNLVDLLSTEHEIYAIVRNSNILKFCKNRNIHIVEADLANFHEDVLPIGIDAIYYLAQSNKFRDFPGGSDDVLAVNVVAPNRLAKWAVKNGVKIFVYASSGGVYSNPEEPVKEFFNINANEKLGFYLNSKLSAEMLLRNYALLFNNFTIIRPFFMYGIGQDDSMLIPRLIINVKNGKEIQLDGQNGIKINPIYVVDAARAVKKTIDLEGEHVINIAGKEPVTLKELCLRIGAILGKDPTFKFSNTEKNDLVADISIMTDKLLQPSMGLKDGLSKVIKRYNE